MNAFGFSLISLAIFAGYAQTKGQLVPIVNALGSGNKVHPGLFLLSVIAYVAIAETLKPETLAFLTLILIFGAYNTI